LDLLPAVVPSVHLQEQAPLLSGVESHHLEGVEVVGFLRLLVSHLLSDQVP
jgi:hypothetical protein